MNKKVFVPVYGFTTDNAILAQYEQLLPGYEAIGFDCNSIITANGAIHCIAMKVPAMVPDIDPCTDWISGDVNNDDTIDIFDILLTVEYILENHQPDQCEAGAADFNNDNTLNVLDVVNLVRHIMGM